MEPTTEMRWWWRGEAPAEVVDWFAGLAGAIEDEHRTDHYLLPASDRDTGVKARAGEQLDVKALVGRDEEVTPAAGFTGTLERWTKWTFPLATDGPDVGDLDAAPWITARKHRWLIERDGCELELVEVVAAGARWWSLAAEAHGVGRDGRRRLDAGLGFLRRSPPPATLDPRAERSYGYAEHLLHVSGARSVVDDGEQHG